MKQEPTYFASPVPHFYEQPEFMPEFKIFHYYWKYLPSGVSGLKWVYCQNRNKFLELLNYWNRDERWKYWEY